MKILNSKELASLEQFFSLTPKQLKKAMSKYLSNFYEKVITTQDYVIALGDLPIGITSHLDTVFKHPPKNIYYDKQKNVMWSPEGLGADDRAGVFSIVQLVKKGYRPTVIFTMDEEIGGLGAEQLIQDYPEAITPLKYIIEMDRQGSLDCVFYDCDNKDFEKYIEHFGFKKDFGSFSDISVICPCWGIAGVNLSVGYYNEHNLIETLNIGEMFNTIYKVGKMFDDFENSEDFIYIPNQENYFLKDWDPIFNISKEDWKDFMMPQAKCACCHEWNFLYEMTPVIIGKDNIHYYCYDCASNSKLSVCNKCGECFLPKNGKDENLCANCQESE